MTIEVSGDEDKVGALENMIKQFGVKEIIRTGLIALERGNKHIKANNGNDNNDNNDNE